MSRLDARRGATLVDILHPDWVVGTMRIVAQSPAVNPGHAQGGSEKNGGEALKRLGGRHGSRLGAVGQVGFAFFQ